MTESERTSRTSSGSMSHYFTPDHELNPVMLDHCYSKPWGAHPDASNAQPMKTLYMAKFPRNPLPENTVSQYEEIIDVVETLSPPPPVDLTKARSLMSECERHVTFARLEESSDDWEDNISRAGWTMQQNRLFTKVVKALQADRQARLTYEGTKNEPIMRRNSIDKTSRRIRQSLASFGWDMKLAQWLHNLLVQNLSLQLLAAYLDVLQTLKSKIPELIDRMLSDSVGNSMSQVEVDGLNLLLKRPWDPVHTAVTQEKLKKLPGGPLLLLAPSGPTSSAFPQTKRAKLWQNQLSNLGKVIPVTMHTPSGGNGVTVTQCLEHMIGAVKAKLIELKNHFPNKPIVLIGWNVGASVACQVALSEPVTAVVCLGFPFTGVNGSRGEVEDSLLDTKVPTYFVVGQHANTCELDDLDYMRERMQAETGLLVVGGADDQLRMTRAKKKREGVTQVIVDRKIMENMCEFLGNILTRSSTLMEPCETPDVHVEPKRKYKRRKGSDDFMSKGFVKEGGQFTGKARLQKDRKSTPAKKRPASTQLTNMPKKRMTLNARLASLKIPVHHHLVPGATELSGLLQRPQTKEETDREGGKSRIILSSSPVLSGANSLSKILSAAALKVSDGGASNISGVNSSTLLASAIKNHNSQEEPKSQSGIKSMTFKQGPGGQHQILVRTGNSSPISIPLSMAQKLVTGSPIVHITSGATSGTSQIHQLLSKMSSSQASTQPVSSLGAPQSSAVLSSGTPTMNEEQPSTSSVSTSTLDESSSETPVGQVLISPSTDSQQVQAIQKLQFHDFPLTTASFTRNYTSAGALVAPTKIISNKIDIGKISMADIHKLAAPTNRSLINRSPITVTIPKVSSSPKSNLPNSDKPAAQSTLTSSDGKSGGTVIMTLKTDGNQIKIANTATAVSDLTSKIPKVKEFIRIPSSTPVKQSTVLITSEKRSDSVGSEGDDAAMLISESGSQTQYVKNTGVDDETEDLPVSTTPVLTSTRTRRIKTPKQFDS